jgi:TolB-like protein
MIYTSVITTVHAEEKLSIAVMDFKITNLAKDETDLLFDFLNNALFETGVFDVIQKNKRNELLKEIAFSVSDAADAEKTHAIGKLLSSKLLLFGSAGKIGSNILYALTMVDVETGKTVSSYSKTYKKLEDIVEDFPTIVDNLASASKRAAFQRKAEVLYFDDFSKQGWPVSDSLFYKNDKLHMYNKESSWYTWELLSIDDVTIEVEAEYVTGAVDQDFGIVFRMKDVDNCYLFTVTKNGYFRIDKRSEGAYTKLAAWEKSSSINSNGANSLKVEALGKHMTFYINKNKVKDLTDPTFKEGRFGLFSAKGVHASFDNLIVYKGRLLFYDSFSANKFEWPIDENVNIKDGEYIIDPPKDSERYFCWGINGYTNIVFKAEASWISGPENSNYGLIFGVQDVDNQYIFEISKNGYYDLSMYLKGNWKTLIPWKKTDAINSKGKNLLAVECRGNMIGLYVNGILLESFKDSNFSKGKIGMESYEGVKVAFDNVQVFEME